MHRMVRTLLATCLLLAVQLSLPARATAPVTDTAGEAVVAAAVPIGPVERTVTGINGLDKLVAKFQPSGLDQGDYELQVSLHHPEGGTLRTSSLAFSVLN